MSANILLLFYYYSSVKESNLSLIKRIIILKALVLCDLVDSTSLVEYLGDQTAAELIRRHDRMASSFSEPRFRGRHRCETAN